MNTVALSAILARANACPPIHFRNQFFDVKKHVLDRFGTKTDVIHWQTIEKRCWGEWYQGGRRLPEVRWNGLVFAEDGFVGSVEIRPVYLSSSTAVDSVVGMGGDESQSGYRWREAVSKH